MKHLNDEELVRLYVDTRKDVYFEYLYDRYSDKVYRKCLSFAKDTARAEDYTHDIFMKLIITLSSYKENAKFSTWLYSITYNFCVDKSRAGKKLAESELNENMDFEDEDAGQADLREIEAVRLRESLEQIATDDKAILLMKYQDDMSIKDIAEIMGVTESAIKMRLKRAKEKVKKLYLENVIFWLIVLTKLIVMAKESTLSFFISWF